MPSPPKTPANSKRAAASEKENVSAPKQLPAKRQRTQAVQKRTDADPSTGGRGRKPEETSPKESQSKESQTSPKVPKRKETKVPKGKVSRSGKGEAISFARRNPPDSGRPLAEWTCIKKVFRAKLAHLTPVSKHEDWIGQ